MGNSHSAEDKNSSISGGGKVRRKSKVFGRFGGKKAKDTSGTSDRGEGHSEGGESKSADHSTASFEQLVEGSTDLDSAREALSIDVASRGSKRSSAQKHAKRPAPIAPQSTSAAAKPTCAEQTIEVSGKPIVTKDDHVSLTSSQDPLFSARTSDPNSSSTNSQLLVIGEAIDGTPSTSSHDLNTRGTPSNSSRSAPANLSSPSKASQVRLPTSHSPTTIESPSTSERAATTTTTRTSPTSTTLISTSATTTRQISNAAGELEPPLEVEATEPILVHRVPKNNNKNACEEATGDSDGKLGACNAAADYIPRPVTETAQNASLSPSSACSLEKLASSQVIDQKSNRKSFIESQPVNAEEFAENRKGVTAGEKPPPGSQCEKRKRHPSKSSVTNSGREIIIVETDSWRTVESLAGSIRRGSTSSDNLQIGSSDVVVLREQTTSSSSDSLFTDPLTPVGFAAEINQCYISEEENVCDSVDEETLREITKAALASRNYSRNTSTDASKPSGKVSPARKNTQQTLSNLSVSEITYLTLDENSPPLDVQDEDSNVNSSKGGSGKDLDTERAEEMPIHFRNKILPLVGSGGTNNTNGNTSEEKNGSNEPGIFNVAKAKKVELQNLSSRIPDTCNAIAPADSTSGKTCSSNDAQPCVVISNLTGRTSPTTPTTTAPTTPAVFKALSSESLENPANDVNTEAGKGASLNTSTAPTTPTAPIVPSVSATMAPGVAASSPVQSAAGDGNVLKKVASFIVERSNGDNTAAKRPSHVPEKLNFAACEKFEGQMLMKWLVTSMQGAGSILNEIDLAALAQQCCVNLLIAGVIKPICDKQQSTEVETFYPYHMYQWSHTELPQPSPSTPGKLDTGIVWPFSSTPFQPKTRQLAEKSPKDVTTNQTHADISFAKLPQNHLRELKKQLLNCDTVDEMCRVFEMVLRLRRSDSAVADSDKDTTRSVPLNDLLNETDVTIYENRVGLSEQPTRRKLELEHQKEDKIIQTSLCDAQSKKDVLVDKDTQTEDNNDRDEDKLQKVAENSGETNEGKVKSEEDSLETKKIGPVLTSAPPPPPPPPPQLEAAGPPPPPPPPLSTALPASPPPYVPPPPPPLPGVNMSAAHAPPPPPPPPAGDLPPPPPPPPMGATGPPPPPPPLLAGSPIPPPLPSSSGPPPPPPPATGSSGSPIPPPPALIMPDGSHQPNTSMKTPPVGGPPPLPMPLPGGAWFQPANTMRKNAVNPPKPMKPLYWTRIVAPKPISAPESTEAAAVSPKEKHLWQEIDETNLDNIDEFTELFSRQAVVPKAKKEAAKPVRIKTIKVLDSKRSQNVGIFSRSLHIDFAEIEHAIYHCDTSVVSLEALQHIMEIKATPEELAMIKDAAQGDIPLDAPEQFLLKISEISSSAERISCIVFQAEFEEGCIQISRKLQIVKHLSEFLTENEDVKLLFSIILTLGNYMNGGNRSRGQADGFGLEILPKLKDVKSKDSKITLLHFIVKTYISQRRKEGVPLPEISLPVPEPGDVDRAITVDFDEVKQQINDLSKKLTICKNTTEKVIASSDPSNVQPFKDKMEQFIETASRKIEKQLKKLNECQSIFIKMMKFYHYIPKSGSLDQCTPGQFFEYWASFTNDFKDIWKKEITLLSSELLKKMKQQNLNVPKASQKVKPGSLKERLQKLSKK